MSPKTKSIKCPKCTERINLPESDEQKLFIKCKSCGATGHIKNPNFSERKSEKVRPKSNLLDDDIFDDLSDIENDLLDDSIGLSSDDDFDYENEPNNINCPKCGDKIIVPHSDRSEIKIKCNNCGAKGRIPNPFLDDKGADIGDEDSEMSLEIIECPKCESDIEVPYSMDDRVIVECTECGAMGKINNPHLLRRELEGPVDHEDLGLENAKGLTETINCPKCKESIELPQSTEPKLKVQCNSCGAKGNVPNPNL